MKNYSYKQKNNFLLIGIALILLLSWQFAIKPSLKARTKYKQFKKLQERAAGAEMQITQYQKLLSNYNADLKNNTAFSRENLLAQVNTFSKNKDIRISDFSDLKTFKEGSYSIQDNSLKIQGAFKDMLELIYYLEQESPYYQIKSLDFNKQRDIRKRTDVLSANIRIRHIENSN